MSVAPDTATSGFTLADYLALPETGPQTELVEGRYVVVNPPLLGHQRVVARMLRLLTPVVPPNWELLTAPTGVRCGEATVLEPDLVLVPAGLASTVRVVEAAVPLVVEIVSPGQPKYDRVYKRSLYAEAGIPNYWLVDLPGERITCLRLDPATNEYAAIVEGPTVTTTEPVEVTLDLAALLAPRQR